jgi:hypothetical protein
MALCCVFTPVLAKHSKSFSLIDCISVGVDRMQRNFEPMRKQVEAWQKSELTDVTAKVVTVCAEDFEIGVPWRPILAVEINTLIDTKRRQRRFVKRNRAFHVAHG